tara:strand:+ start:804 stop:1343 length:540 start_codon:yes stop_codon:yes gene_type:complete
MQKTSQQFDVIIENSATLFEKKMKDYGSAWRILRLTSLTDQIFIKAQRIRTIENNGVQKIEEGITSEFIGILNYSLIALVQLKHGVADQADMNLAQALEVYSYFANEAKDLMEAKNHDYGEAWREMRVSSFTDLILQKLLRIRQIEDNQGRTLVSEGIDANYFDIVNYAVFALIHLKNK